MQSLQIKDSRKAQKSYFSDKGHSYPHSKGKDYLLVDHLIFSDFRDLPKLEIFGLRPNFLRSSKWPQTIFEI